MGEEILVVVTQCLSHSLLLPTRTHHSYTSHTKSLRGVFGNWWWVGDWAILVVVTHGCGGAGAWVRWMGEREILVVVTQCLLLPARTTRTHHSYTTHIKSLRVVLGKG